MHAQPTLAKQVHLRKNEEHRVIAGHPWIFSNEIREILGSPSAGDVVEAVSSAGRSLGIGFYNPHSLISVRLVSTTVEDIDHDFFVGRLSDAVELRRKILPGATAYRLVHGEGDFLPGLVIDRYNTICVLQTLSYGMDLRTGLICEALEHLLQPLTIVERNESPLRPLDGLPKRKGILRGESATTIVEEHGLAYEVDTLEGQKTGFFLDQRDNRLFASRVCNGARVLDCFCNDGGFALNAARGGATSVLGIDIAGDAVRRAQANAERNRVAGCSFRHGDVFSVLPELHSSGERFDVVILDPPSFTRSRKTVPSARKGYRDLHRAALQVLKTGGLLLTASCSHHIEPETFLEDIDRSVRSAGRKSQLLEWRGASADHPSLLSAPETRYLKFAVLKIF